MTYKRRQAPGAPIGAFTTAGAGLTSTGSTVDAVGTAGQIVVSADSIGLATTAVTPGTYNSVTVDSFGRATAGSLNTIAGGTGSFTTLSAGATTFSAFSSVAAGDASYTLYGPNSFGRSLRVGNFTDILPASTGQVGVSSAAIHIDASTPTGAINFNYFKGSGVFFGDGNQNNTASITSAGAATFTADTRIAGIVINSTAVPFGATFIYRPVADTLGFGVAGTEKGRFTATGLEVTGTISATGGFTGNSATATQATNLSGGVGGSIPYQSSVNTTVQLANGAAGQVLQSNGGTAAPSWAAAAGPVNWLEAGSIAAPNNVVGAVVWRVVSSLVDSDAAIEPKGTGAFLLQIPDSTAAGGNKRGTYAVDLQRNRATAALVASGNNSVISGGVSNQASGLNSVVAGGNSNAATASTATVSGGQSNANAGIQATIGGGNANIISSGATSGTIAGGSGNSITGTGTQGTVGGGLTNVVSGTNSVVSGGDLNTSSGTRSTVSGGGSNSAASNNSTIAGGSTNTISSTAHLGVISGGTTNTVSAAAQGGVIAGGNANTVSSSATYATVSGGQENTAGAPYATVPGGRGATTRAISGAAAWSGQKAFGAGALGDSQEGKYLLKVQMTGTTATRLSTDQAAASATNQIVLPDNSSFAFAGEMIARNAANGDTALWRIEGGIRRGAGVGSVVFVGTPTVTVIATDAGAVTWSATVTADTTLGCLGVTVAAAAAITVRAVANLRVTELVY